MTEPKPSGAARTNASAIAQAALLDRVPQRVFAKDADLRYTYCNLSYAQLLGVPPAEVIGKTDEDLLPPDLAAILESDDRRVMQEGMPASIVVQWPGQEREGPVRMIKAPMQTDGAVTGVLAILWSMAHERMENEQARARAEIARDRAEQARERAEEAMVRQAMELQDISVPVIEVWDGIVAVPLIGTLDSQRTQQMTERLLETIVQTRSSVALIDITGVPTVDTQTGRHLLETIAATRLLGADIVLTGVRPVIAQTLVHLGIDLRGVITRPSLAAGLRVALDVLGLQVTTRS